MKRLFAIILGVVAGIAIVFIGDSTCKALSPLPKGLDSGNRDEMRIFIDSIPIYVLVIMTIFWLGSSFLGAMLAVKINRVYWKQTALITGGILLALALLNLIMTPHPAWMWLAALMGYLPVALLGGYLARPKSVPLPWA